MAGIAGIYCADGRPAELAELKRIAASVKDRGPDGIAYWNRGPVALAHLQFCTTPESLREHQPLVAPGGDVCLVWNGRVDNREELRGALAATGAQPVDETDPGFVLAAYLAWGTECVQRIVGDFAMAVWDARQRRLWCARDYIGIRPFYYFWDGKTFLFGPEIRALLAHPLVSLKINEGMVGEYLADEITSRDESLYADIRRLPSGSTLTIDSGGALKIETWWNPELGLLEYKTDEEYSEHYRALFDEAVRAQMRSNTRVSAMLSGGLDSSSIAATAQMLLDAEGMPGQRVSTVSLVSPGKPWDESEYIAEIAGFAGLRSECVIPAQNLDEGYFRKEAEWSKEFPAYPISVSTLVPISEAARRQNIRVLLSGVGGDEWLPGQLPRVTDLISNLGMAWMGRFPLSQARKDFEDYRSFSGNRHWAMFIMRGLLAESAPGWVHLRRRKRHFVERCALSDAFMRRTGLVDRCCSPPERPMLNFHTPLQEDAFRNAVRGGMADSFEYGDSKVARAGLEARHPFLNRRLAEFCLRLPDDQRYRGRTWKWVLRNAIQGRLPERVRVKNEKAEFSELSESLLSTSWAQARLRNLAISRQTDWLDAHRFHRQLSLQTQTGMSPKARFDKTWVVLGIDLWFENLQASDKSSTFHRMH